MTEEEAAEGFERFNPIWERVPERVLRAMLPYRRERPEHDRMSQLPGARHGDDELAA